MLFLQKNLSTILNLKYKNYEDFKEELYLVSANDDEIKQSMINDVIENRETRLSENIKVLSTEEFFTNIKNIKPYKFSTNGDLKRVHEAHHDLREGGES